MGLAGAPRHQQRGNAEQRTLERKQIDEGNDPPLRQHGERHQQQHRGARVEQLQVPRRIRHRQAPSNRWTSMPSTANRNAVARNSGARNTRSFAETVSMNAMPTPASTSFAARTNDDTARPSGAWLVDRPHGMNRAKPMQT